MRYLAVSILIGSQIVISYGFVSLLASAHALSGGFNSDINHPPVISSNSTLSTTTTTHLYRATTVGQCKRDQFRCADGSRCIDRKQLCDALSQCDDGSDESGHCKDNSCQHEHGCEHGCRNTPDGYGFECYCKDGYRLLDDGNCEDVDECNQGHGYCQHHCINMEGGYKCQCASGYHIQNDGSSCELDSKNAGQILFSVGHQIRNIPWNSWLNLHEDREYPDSSVMAETQLGRIEALDTNVVNNHYYYTKNGGIYANSHAEICLLQRVHGNVAVDWITGNIYYVNEPMPAMVGQSPSSRAGLGICTADGQFCKLLFTHDDDVGTPRGLALHPKYGLMFWTDWGKQSRIERSNMDGTDRGVIVSDRLGWPNAITIDYVHDLVYFADSEFNLIESCKLDGTHRKVVIKSGVFHPFDMVVFDDHVLWTDWGLYGVMVHRISMDPNHPDHHTHRSIYHSEHEQPYGIGINHPAYQQKDLPNPCANAVCSHICALTSNISASCLCPTNYEFRSGSNRKECIPVTNRSSDEGAHWCLDAFATSCKVGKGCQNNGSCQNKTEHDVVVDVYCECPPGFVGQYCEVPLVRPGSNADSSSNSGQSSPSEQKSSGHNAGAIAGVVFVTFVIITAAIVIIMCRYGKHKRLPPLRWSPSVIFHKGVLSAKNRDVEQRQRIISTTEDGSSSKLYKTESFSNPIYEEVQVPIHQAYTIMKRENSTLSHDSDADSGLEFNTSNGSP